MSTHVSPTAVASNSSDQTVEEQTLLVGLLDDCPVAWRDFNLRYGGLLRASIYRIAQRFRGLLTTEDTREIYAQLFVNLLAHDKHRLRAFDPNRGVRLGSWLSMIAVHTAYDHLRALRRQPAGTSIDELPDLHADLPDPDDRCLRREQAHQVSSLLRELSAKDREFMLLYFGQGLSPTQVAKRMGISIKTVYTKKHKIRGRLESMLQGVRVAA